MKTATRIALGCGILTMGLAFVGAAPANAQDRAGAAAAPEPRTSGDQKAAPDVTPFSSNAVLLPVLPWDLPDVAGGYVAPAVQHLRHHRNPMRRINPFWTRNNGR